MPEAVQTIQEALTTLRRLIGTFQERVRELSDRNDPLYPEQAHQVLTQGMEILADQIDNFSDNAQECVNQINELKDLIKDLKVFRLAFHCALRTCNRLT
jgi:methyl-accepting chemotaxis protein